MRQIGAECICGIDRMRSGPKMSRIGRLAVVVAMHPLHIQCTSSAHSEPLTPSSRASNHNRGENQSKLGTLAIGGPWIEEQGSSASSTRCQRRTCHRHTVLWNTRRQSASAIAGGTGRGSQASDLDHLWLAPSVYSLLSPSERPNRPNVLETWPKQALTVWLLTSNATPRTQKETQLRRRIEEELATPSGYSIRGVC